MQKTDTGLVILWDIDGPLNPFAAKPHRRPEGYTTHRLSPQGHENAVGADGRRLKPYRVWLNPEHGPKMLQLADDLRARNWWATSWRGDANRLIAPILGLPEFPLLIADGQPIGREWKWSAAVRLLTQLPLIWFDDDFDDPFHRDGRDRFDRDRSGIPTLLYHVDPRLGLRDEDFAAARAWAVSQRLVTT